MKCQSELTNHGKQIARCLSFLSLYCSCFLPVFLYFRCLLVPFCIFLFPSSSPPLTLWIGVPFQPIKSLGRGEASICTIRGRGDEQTVVQHNGKHCYDPPTQYMHTPAISHNGPPSSSIFSLSISYDPLGEYDIWSVFSCIRITSTHAYSLCNITRRWFHSFLARACGLEKSPFTFCTQNQK